MFRKIFLRKTLKRVASQLMKLYGSSPFYTSAQVEKAFNLLKLSKDFEYCLALFVDPKTRKDMDPEEIRNVRLSLFRYFAPEVLEIDIDRNHFRSILKMNEHSPVGAHTPIDMNSNITPFTSGHS